MDIKITVLFDKFIKYQVDIESIAAACRKTKRDNFLKVLAALAAFFSPEDPAEVLKEGTIIFEFEKALAYHICRINNTLH